MTQQACIISNLSVEFHHQSLFDSLNFQLPYVQCSGLIGRNGQGKSVLLTLLAHFNPNIATGHIDWQCPYAYLAQLQRVEGYCIADALGVSNLYQIFHKINLGQADISDFEQVEQLWHLPSEWQNLLQQANLLDDLSFPLHQLSEGQKTKLALCRLFLLKDHYLLLDEPSNHLDHHSRQWLIHALKSHPAGCLVVSHDRVLLNHMQHIFALNQFGITHHQSNYQHYAEQQQQHIQALERDIAQEKTELKQLKIQQHETLMKAQKRQRAGQKMRASGSQAKVLLDFNKEQASHSHARLTQQQHRQQQQSEIELQHKKQQLEVIKAQQFRFNLSALKSGEILRLTDVTLPYAYQGKIDFALHAGEKIHLIGENGCGKSTLLKIIHGDLKPQSGHLFFRGNSVYLDQNFSILNPEYHAVANLNQINPKISEVEWRNLLGQLRIRRDKALLPLKYLSGGEKLKIALLALSQMDNIDVLLLDEPDNHLDIESKQLLAQAIADFSGAVILVSHDDAFVQDTGIYLNLALSL